MNHRRLLTICVLVGLFVLQPVRVASEPPPVPSYPLISIVLGSTVPNPTPGTGLGITADIKNVSRVPPTTVYLRSEDLNMTTPPELRGPFSGYYHYFAAMPTEEKPIHGVIALRSEDSYRVFWKVGPVKEESERPNPDEPAPLRVAPKVLLKDLLKEVLSQLSFMFFSPGDYEITVTAKYWTDPKFPGDDYHTITATKMLRVAAPQFVILFGAGLGGLIAYIILPEARRRLVAQATSDIEGLSGLLSNFANRVGVEVLGVLIAALVSMLGTILLSRISQTQFPIQVTITDFWGAIAIGFAANYGGTKLLTRLLGTSAEETPQAPPKPKASE